MPPSDDQLVFTVSQLNREVRLLLEQQFGFLWLEGEISNLSRPTSGHWYFSLKDSRAQIRCAMFRNRNRALKFDPQNGEQVLVRGALGLYEARGEFQLVVERMEPIGEGALQRRFEATKQKLLAEGLFDEQYKLELPSHPKTIGVITSATGAAIRDVLHVLRRRYPPASIIVYPTPVQGEQAARQIAEAIRTADERDECDVLLLVRGGGSLEDLWSFNEEVIAYTIHACSLPIVCGVGHETDFTIADLVADVRAPTPSAAAEIATPDVREEQNILDGLAASLHEALQNRLKQWQNALIQFRQRLQAQHPQRRLQQKIQRVDEFEQRIKVAMDRRLSKDKQSTAFLDRRLTNATPQKIIQQYLNKIYIFQKDIKYFKSKKLETENHRLGLLLRALHNVSPLATLGRGYAVVKTIENMTVRSVTMVDTGDRIITTVMDGDLHCVVEYTTLLSD